MSEEVKAFLKPRWFNAAKEEAGKAPPYSPQKEPEKRQENAKKAEPAMAGQSSQSAGPKAPPPPPSPPSVPPPAARESATNQHLPERTPVKKPGILKRMAQSIKQMLTGQPVYYPAGNNPYQIHKISTTDKVYYAPSPHPHADSSPQPEAKVSVTFPHPSAPGWNIDVGVSQSQLDKMNEFAEQNRNSGIPTGRDDPSGVGVRVTDGAGNGVSRDLTFGDIDKINTAAAAAGMRVPGRENGQNVPGRAGHGQQPPSRDAMKTALGGAGDQALAAAKQASQTAMNQARDQVSKLPPPPPPSQQRGGQAR
jgi:hypothetical protein